MDVKGYFRVLAVVFLAAPIYFGGCTSSNDPTSPTNPNGGEQSPPLTPGNLVAVAISRIEIRLTWTDRSSNETGFQIFESVSNDTSFEMVLQVGANIVTTVLSPRSREIDYYYKVRAVNDYGFSNFTGVSEVAGGELLMTIDTGDSPVMSVAYDPLGRYVVAGCGDYKVRRYSADTGAPLQESRLHDGMPLVLSVTCSPDGRYIASGGQDKRVKVWDIDESRVVWTFDAADMDQIKQLEYNQDGSRLAGLCGMVRIWDMNDGSVIDDLVVSGAMSFAYISDDQYLVLATNYGLEIWEVGGADVALVKHRTSVGRDIAVSPDRSIVASVFDFNVMLWQVSGTGASSTFTLVSQDNIAPEDRHTDVVYAVDFSSDGVYLASGSRDDKIKIWKVADFSLETTLDAHTTAVNCLDYSNQGNFLVSGGGDTKVKIWAMFF